jgi:hypothetical protein
MSALPPKADMCSATAHVCFGPKADISHHMRHVRFALSDALRLSDFIANLREFLMALLR